MVISEKRIKKGILQKSGTEFSTHRRKQKTTSYGEEMEILKKQGGYCKKKSECLGTKDKYLLTVL